MTRELKLKEGSDAVVMQGAIKVAFNASGITVNVRGAAITVDQNGTVAVQAAANDAGKALEVGDHLQDGTVVIAVDLKKDKALFAPEGIFGGKSTFDGQDKIPQNVNRRELHGHDDWRRITDAEGKMLSDAWDKVAPPELKGSDAPWFWFASSSSDDDYGRVHRGGEPGWIYDIRGCSLPVPVVRSGPARS